MTQHARRPSDLYVTTQLVKFQAAGVEAALQGAIQPLPAVPDDDLIRHAVASVVGACDLVFGVTATALASFSTWLLATAQVNALIAVALWSVIAINLLWSSFTRGRNSVVADLARGVVSLPIAVYVYVGGDGRLLTLWIPALMLTVGIALSTGIASRRSLAGVAITFTYCCGLLVGSAVTSRSIGLDMVNDVLGIALTGIVTSLVSSKLGRMLDEVGRQRDSAHEQKHRANTTLAQLTERSHELTVALTDLHAEMELRVRAETELRHAQKLEAVGRLASGIAHEINTPVQFVSDSLDFIRESVTELLDAVATLEPVARSVLDGGASRDTAERAVKVSNAIDLPYLTKNVPRALDRAVDGLSRVATIVRSMKEFAHPDSEDMEVADVNHAIESTLVIARNEYKEIAELETRLGELPMVRCFIGELNQAVLNIVVNAAHAIEDAVKGKGAMGRIRVETRRDGDDVIIAIADTGGGIPAEIQGKIFDPFFTTKAVGRGTGQGLAVAHSVIVDKHHGRLTFETEAGKGTTFFLRIPIEGYHMPATPGASSFAPDMEPE